MAIQPNQKSTGDRTSQARRATSNRPEQTAVTPAILPESAAPDTPTAEWGSPDGSLSDTGHQTVEIRMC